MIEESPGVKEFLDFDDRKVKMKAFLLQLWREDEGQDMVEYALLLSFIVVCAAAILTTTRGQISTTWSTISSSLSSAISTSGS